MTDIFIAASKNGLCNVQFNIIDADTLIDAQKHPEKHNNLAVRVSGFSQKFNLLTPELQDHIIGRTKHTCL
jgi:formate C-acetyltransferase